MCIYRHVSRVLTIASILVLLPKLSLQQYCSSAADLGRTDCVLITRPSYDARQWATCVTEDYMMRASGGWWQCVNEGVTQCWYQCMLEIYDFEGGLVNADCSCTPDEMLPNNSRLPAECYSPRGDNCQWYEDCLEMRYPCRGTDDGYAIEYAQKFCNLYSDNYNDFSSTGRQWVDEVRRCLQVALVPSLRLWVTHTCAAIREEAFDSHAGCYTDVDPSMCELSCADIWRAFVIVNFPSGDFTEGALVTAPLATIQQMLSVMLRCYTNEELSGCIKNLLTTLEIAVKVGVRNLPLVRTATGAFFVARHVARTLSWVENGLGWYPLYMVDYYDNDSDRGHKKRQDTDEEIINFRVLLVDMKILNTSNSTMSQPPSGQTIDQAVDNMVNAVMNGSLSMIPLNINNTEVNSSLSVVSQCMDISCNSSNMTELVIAPTPTEIVNTPTESVTTPTESVTTPTESVTTPTKTPAGGGTKILHLNYLALYTAFAAVVLMK